MNAPISMPLEIARETWRNAIEGDGAYCPCCDKWGKVYKMKLSQHLALCLRWIATHGDEDGWVDVQNSAPRWILKSKTYNLLVHWGLIQGRDKRSGVWRATPRGRDFINANCTMPAAVYIYNNQVWGVDATQTSFRGCFGKHFNFDEMMSTQFRWSEVVTRRGKNT